jgi:DNA gyrase/topoisomerase IV subunit B
MTRRKIAGTDVEQYESEFAHYLDRPEYVLGNSNPITTEKFFIDSIGWKEVTYVPAVLKLFDEVISNAVDEAIRTDFKHAKKIKVEFSCEDGWVTIEDSGRGIPIVQDEKTGKWLPEMVFSELRTGSNFDDESKAETLGRFGVGVSLTNLFSSEFRINIVHAGQEYKQIFQNNLTIKRQPGIQKTTKKSGTSVGFVIDWKRFIENWDTSCFGRGWLEYEPLFEQRVRDLALCYPEIQFWWNKKKVSGRKPAEIFSLVAPDFTIGESEKCRLAVMYSDHGFRVMSWVNGIETSKGGTHVEYACSSIIEAVREHIRKRYKIDVRPSEVRNRLFIFLSLRTGSTNFDSQAKEAFTTSTKEFADRIEEVLTEKFIKSILKNDRLIESIVEVYQLREEVKQKREVKKLSKVGKVKIPKLVEAQSKDTEKNILMICEGDSAISELINVRNPNIGGIPIRGKLLNVFDKKAVDVLNNAEIRALVQCIGLEIGKPPKNLNYGRIGILTDMDGDGNAIAGLLINFFYKYWPGLFEEGRIIRVLSPLYTAENKGKIKRFYSKTELEKAGLDKSWKIKYNKGLGALGADEYELVLNKLEYIELVPGKETADMIRLVYSSDTDARKEWLVEVKK